MAVPQDGRHTVRFCPTGDQIDSPLVQPPAFLDLPGAAPEGLKRLPVVAECRSDTGDRTGLLGLALWAWTGARCARATVVHAGLSARGLEGECRGGSPLLF
ncbi:hypothetical protein NDU88_005715 [Pleurodeles waltl]|uniref:Uncharacterized protein n=1 Tax=Pleurodeles waltl TaxID=8319 RepID=A0AAV7RN00_PLEWA|nr:hypothetical protein NDU88_005715 [Pleurodeles waltl]